MDIVLFYVKTRLPQASGFPLDLEMWENLEMKSHFPDGNSGTLRLYVRDVISPTLKPIALCFSSVQSFDSAVNCVPAARSEHFM